MVVTNFVMDAIKVLLEIILETSSIVQLGLKQCTTNYTLPSQTSQKDCNIKVKKDQQFVLGWVPVRSLTFVCASNVCHRTILLPGS